MKKTFLFLAGILGLSVLAFAPTIPHTVSEMPQLVQASDGLGIAFDIRDYLGGEIDAEKERFIETGNSIINFLFIIIFIIATISMLFKIMKDKGQGGGQFGGMGDFGGGGGDKGIMKRITDNAPGEFAVMIVIGVFMIGLIPDVWDFMAIIKDAALSGVGVDSGSGGVTIDGGADIDSVDLGE